MAKKIRDVLLCALFLFALILPLATFNRVPDKVSETENRALAQFPQIFNRSGGIAPGIKSNLTNWFNDNLGLRETLVRASANIQYGFFQRSPSEKVSLGKNGWLFYAIENNLDIARGTYPLTDSILLSLQAYHERNAAMLRERGIGYALTFPPSKVSVYPEMLSFGGGIRETPCDSVEAYLAGHSSLRVANLKPALLRAKETAQVYYAQDSHWNNEGAYAAYAELLARLTEWGVAEGAAAGVELVAATHKGDLVKLMGNPTVIEDEAAVFTNLSHPTAEKVASGPLYDQMALLKERHGYHDILAYENAASGGKKLLVIGDSIFSYTIPELLAENVSLLVYVWDPERDLSEDLLSAIQPDFVLYEMGERNIASFFK